MDSEDGTIRLSRREQKRALVLTQVREGVLTHVEAAALLGLSVRQVRRLVGAYGREGPAALVHGNRGRVPWHALTPEVRARVAELAGGKYAGLNHVHLTEKLEEEGLYLGRTTVRNILLAAGLRSPRTRRVPAHRRRRERYPREGLLLQADASPHRWFGPDGPEVALVGAIDDATGTVPWAVFRAQEDAVGYLLLLQGIATTKGLPHALYVDRHGIFQKRTREPLTLEEELAGRRLPTQVGRALEELGIRRIDALSPQAKGRIERLWRTLQDRLVAELRLAGLTTVDEANAFLPGFLARFNARFAVPPTDPTPAWRPPPDGLDLARVLCFKYERVVRPDNTVHFAGRLRQLEAGRDRLSWARARVEVHERLDGSLAIYSQDTLIHSTQAPPDAPTLRARTGPRPGSGPPQAPAPPAPALPPPPTPRAPWKPAANHPWRRSMVAGRTKSHDS